MSTDPESIASIIQGQTDLPSGVVPGGEEDQAALLTYLKTHYSDPAGTSNPLGTGDIASLPTATFRQTPTPTPAPVDHKADNQNHDYSQYQIRAASPPNPSISIPPVLAQLASQSSITISIPSFASDFNTQHVTGSFDERGEMGGKRRKLPHQRAGWKEMDEEPKLKRRRAGRKPANSIGDDLGQGQGQGGEGIDLMHHQPQTQGGDGQEGMYLVHHHDHQQSQQQQQHQHQMPDPGVGVSLGEMAAAGSEPKPMENDFSQFQQSTSQPQLDNQPQPETKDSRAIQNRRAQQVFRRKREEHMKKLEADSAALGTATHHLALAEARLREVALLLEAEHIEKLALQLTLRNVSHSGTSILDTEGTLVTQAGIPLRHGANDTEEEMQRAFKTLETQSRELAKVNRSKRV